VAYELFERSSTRVDTPALAITPDGRVAINAAACRLLQHVGAKTVVILWDSGSNTMAVKVASGSDKNAFTITFAADSHAGSFRAKSFFDHIGWHAARRVGVPTIWNPAEKMFEVSLPTQHFGPKEKAKGRVRRL
jgi:hypothetical protein